LQVFDRLLEIALLLQQDMAQSFEGTALTASRTHLLWEVHRLGPSTQQALAQALEVTPRNITGLVDALESAGYLRRQPHPSDRRATLVTLTDLGTRTINDMTRQREEAATQLVSGFDGEELARLVSDLDTLTERLQLMAQVPRAARVTP